MSGKRQSDINRALHGENFLKQTKQKIKKKTQELIIVILWGYFRVGDLMRTLTPHQEELDGNAMIFAMWL